jgi:hypothetical protein
MVRQTSEATFETAIEAVLPNDGCSKLASLNEGCLPNP